MAKSQVRMMSCPCGRMSIGKIALEERVRRGRAVATGQPAAICGVSDDVAHVSMMSGSATKPPATPRCASS